MKRIATLLTVLCAAALLPPAASAAPGNAGLSRLFGIARVTDTIVIPPEWGGIWDVVDTTYDCSGNFNDTSTEPDTLCPGVRVVDSGEMGVDWSCTGSADANSVNVTCTGTMEAFPDCDATYTYVLSGTRSGDTYFVVLTMSVTYAGSAKGCDLIPTWCTQTNSHGTRTAPTPAEYCQTPTRSRSWGELKVRYH